MAGAATPHASKSLPAGVADDRISSIPPAPLSSTSTSASVVNAVLGTDGDNGARVRSKVNCAFESELTVLLVTPAATEVVCSAG
jgi:hypothetical protein